MLSNFWHMGILTLRAEHQCPDVKNYKWRLNPVRHRMLYSCIHMATVSVKGLTTASKCTYIHSGLFSTMSCLQLFTQPVCAGFTTATKPYNTHRRCLAIVWLDQRQRQSRHNSSMASRRLTSLIFTGFVFVFTCIKSQTRLMGISLHATGWICDLTKNTNLSQHSDQQFHADCH